MTDAKDRLKQLEKDATPGPWAVYPDSRPGIDQAGRTGHERNVIYCAKFAGQFAGVGRNEDADFIVAIRNVAPELIAVVEAAREITGDFEDDYCFGCHESRPCAHDTLTGALDALDEKSRPKPPSIDVLRAWGHLNRSTNE